VTADDLLHLLLIASDLALSFAHSPWSSASALSFGTLFVAVPGTAVDGRPYLRG
jgi:hypothetical protein